MDGNKAAALRNNASKKRSAVTGDYGAPAFSALRENALALLDCINTELGDAEWFTRDDLLKVSAFSHVSTITRYRYTCEAVGFLLRRKPALLIQPKGSKNTLALPGRAQAFETPLALAERHMPTIKAVVRGLSGRGAEVVVVPDVLAGFNPRKEHLTENIRRAVVRIALRRMAMGGVLAYGDRPGTYLPAPEDDAATDD